ncbi:integrase [Pseudomonas sp. J237]|nr:MULTISPECIES: site-specific integrase [Pseudomonas]OEO23508.1 integrase [Pseudomonas sp. J237]
MKIKITDKVLTSLAPKEKVYRIHDTKQPGLLIRVLPSGHASYMVAWARNKATTLGRVGKMTLDQARFEAAQCLAEAHAHGEPLVVTQGRRGAALPTLDQFLTDQFEGWAKVHQKDAVNSIRAIRSSYAVLLPERLDKIDANRIERLRVSWLDGGLSPASANRNLVRIKGLLSRAVDWGVLQDHPLSKVRRLKVDQQSRVRFLSADESRRLREALDARQETIRAERDSANRWRVERSTEPLQDLRALAFVDHLKPLVLLSLNTGMRRGEVFNLTWADIDLTNKVLTVEGTTAKSGQTRHIPLNREALATLTDWKDQASASAYVFPSQSGGRMDNVKKSWEGLLKLARISGFRWHDLRHTFASKLVVAGVPLNTVRELLGHSDIKMTLRYAHLAPDSKAAAVELI